MNHPVVEHCMRVYGLPDSARRAGGGATLLVDDAYRIHVVPSAQGWVALLARLCGLPRHRGEREALLLHCGTLAFGMLGRHAATLAMDRHEENLLLQQMLRPGFAVGQFPETLGGFVNALAVWREIAASGAAS